MPPQQIYNPFTQCDLQTSIAIAKATMRDSPPLKTVAVQTMVFAPATFVCIRYLVLKPKLK